jgi:hypothetical protein
MGVWDCYSTVNKQQWRKLANVIDERAEKGDLLLFNAGFNELPFDYYSKRTDLIKRPFPEDTSDVNEEDMKKLEPSVGAHDRVWVILAHSGDINGSIKKVLSRSYKLSYSKQYESITHNKYHHIVEVSLFEQK